MKQLDPIWQSPLPQQLAVVFAEIGDPTEMQCFLRDVLTEKEIIEISARLQAARMLSVGKTYTEIIAVTKLSSRTVARISDWAKNGQNGYAVAERILAEHDHIPPARAA